jgi:hypothetical protein
MEDHYQISFRGEIVQGHDLHTVKQNLAALFKVEAHKIEQMFSRRSFIVKKKVDYRTALRYKHAIEKTGAVCYMTAISHDDHATPDLTQSPPEHEPALVATTPEEETFKTLMKQLSDKDFQVRRAAVFGLEKIGGPAAVSALITAADDDHFQVRRAAVCALGAFEGANVVAALKNATKDAYTNVRKAAASALENMGITPDRE